MLVDDQGRFMTQRKMPRMTLFKTFMVGDLVEIRYEGDSMSLPQVSEGPAVRCQVWSDEVEVVEANPEYHAWFSKRLSLADGYPILIIGQSSLDDLNQRLSEPVKMNRFRPNLVFTGGMPYEEDSWNHFRIGSSSFAGVKPCDRCVLTTVNPETGETGREPLLTLSRYRIQNEKIYFGQNVVPIELGKINVGDEISLG